jgi:hypothetical protein
MMTIGTREPYEVMKNHLGVLRQYAEQVVVNGEPLTREEEADKSVRMQEYLTLGDSMHVTAPEMVTLLYKGVLVGEKTCDCLTCRAREGDAA